MNLWNKISILGVFYSIAPWLSLSPTNFLSVFVSAIFHSKKTPQTKQKHMLLSLPSFRYGNSVVQPLRPGDGGWWPHYGPGVGLAAVWCSALWAGGLVRGGRFSWGVRSAFAILFLSIGKAICCLQTLIWFTSNRVAGFWIMHTESQIFLDYKEFSDIC